MQFQVTGDDICLDITALPSYPLPRIYLNVTDNICRKFNICSSIASGILINVAPFLTFVDDTYRRNYTGMVHLLLKWTYMGISRWTGANSPPSNIFTLIYGVCQLEIVINGGINT